MRSTLDGSISHRDCLVRVITILSASYAIVRVTHDNGLLRSVHVIYTTSVIIVRCSSCLFRVIRKGHRNRSYPGQGYGMSVSFDYDSNASHRTRELPRSKGPLMCGRTCGYLAPDVGFGCLTVEYSSVMLGRVTSVHANLHK